MSKAGPAIRNTSASRLAQSFNLHAVPPALVMREVSKSRTKIWEFSTNLHCSIIGTCLSSAELRQVLRKFGLVAPGCTDHDLHKVGVTIAGRQDEAARHLHKALDHRHKLAIHQFAKADSEATLRKMWCEAVKRGDIPGAYWATLTHPRASRDIIRDAFGEVHMLSHLVGSANRADIRRLCVLETEKAELQEKLDRQQNALHQAVVTRDAQIAALRSALTAKVIGGSPGPGPDNDSALRGVIADLERRLAAETRRRVSVEERLSATRDEAARERSARIAAERDAGSMRRELEAVEQVLTPETERESHAGANLNGLVVLYVGSRPNQVAAMRAATDRIGGVLLHHDGGIESQTCRLPGLVSRADVVMFPVDCISHEAVNTVKALCRQSGKRFVPLRSASVTSLLSALTAHAFSDAAD